MSRRTEIIMGMPITVEICHASPAALDPIFTLFRTIDQRFSPWIADSEVTALNAGRLPPGSESAALREVLDLAEATLRDSDGYFDIRQPSGNIDPCGIVKGWALRNAARAIRAAGFCDFHVEAGGDIQTGGVNAAGQPWRVGIRNPFDPDRIVQVICPQGRGVATSGSYIRGAHIYNPHDPDADLTRVVSLTVIGPDVFEADRFATAAFAMGEPGIGFIERREGLEGYMIDCDGIATQTSGFTALTQP